MTTTGHKDPAGIYWPLARQRQLYFVLQHPHAVFFTESNTQPSSIFLLKRMSYIRFLISTYSFTSSYTHIIILKTQKIPFSYLHPYFCCFSLPALIFCHWFSLKPTQLSHVLFAYKNKMIFWQINKFLKNVYHFGITTVRTTPKYAK